MTTVEINDGPYLFGYRVHDGKVHGGWVYPAPEDFGAVWRRWLELVPQAEKEAGWANLPRVTT